MGRRAVFCDRDGVLNEPVVREGRPFAVQSVEDLVVPDDVPDGCSKLREHGFLVVVVTNQPDIARGTMTSEALGLIHDVLRERVPLDDIYTCPHDDANECGCRKPKPGLLLDASADLDIELSQSYLIGDRWRDIEAGFRAGCRTVHLDRGYEEPPPVNPDCSTRSFTDAVQWVMGGVASS